MLAQGQVEETWELFLAALEAVLIKNRELELLVAKLRRERLGAKSERIDPAQLVLLLEALVAQEGPATASDPEAEAREDAELDRAIEHAEHAQPRAERTRRPPGPGWQTRGVPREVHRVEVPEAERTCRGCGRVMRPIGEDVSRRLEYVPASFVEHEYHRAKYACGTCQDGVTTAPAPPQVLERSAASASLLAHVVVSKYADHTPCTGSAASTPGAGSRSRSRRWRTGRPGSGTWWRLWWSGSRSACSPRPSCGRMPPACCAT